MIQSKSNNRPWFMTKSSSEHQHVEAHRNSPQKRTQGVEKSTGTIKTELRTIISVKIFSSASSCRGSPKQTQERSQRVEKPPGTFKTEPQLWFATKSSPGHQYVEAHRNSPQKRTQRVEKLPGIFKTELQTMICDKIVSWASACLGSPK